MLTIHRVALAAPALLLVAACGASSTSQDSSASRASDHSSAIASGSAGGKAADHGTAVAASPAAEPVADTPPSIETRAVISNGQITLHSPDPDAVLTRLQSLLAGWQGLVANEQSSANPKGRTTDTELVLRVPSSRFAEAMTAISGLGQLVRQSRTSQDVTTKVIDNNVRVRAQKESLRQMELLLSRATTIGQILSIEDQLSVRQANLDSLESQQKYLADQTSLATIDVSISLPPKGVVHQHTRRAGFLSGLSGGWHTLGRSTVAVLTAVGAVLPFALVLGVVGFPVLVLVRRRLHAKPAAAAQT